MKHLTYRAVAMMVGLLGVFALVAAESPPASAQALSYGYAYVDPAASCNADRHTVELRMSMVKDTRFQTQYYQFQYRLTDLATGASAYFSPVTRAVSGGGDTFNFAFSMPSGGRYRFEYTVRFSTLSGYYNAWANWTPTGQLETWARKLWWEQPVTYCMT